jgi:hypothetical protein
MVKRQNKTNTKNTSSKGIQSHLPKAREINASTAYGVCQEQLSPFGGILALIKFLDLIQFKTILEHVYQKPSREPKLGHYRMIVGILILLFIGFNRLWHFTYIRLDAMICGFFSLRRLPDASTFWRYLDSLEINQARSFLKIMSFLRERVWQQCALKYKRIHLSIDTTVETIYGNQQGGRVGHNPKHPGKKGYRPIPCFIDETREYLLGKLRKGQTVDGEESAKFIKQIKAQLPGCVKSVLLRADGEFFSWKTISAVMEEGFDFIIANKRGNPPLDPQQWYQPWKRKPYEYNSTIYQPMGWKKPCRFVAMRIAKEQENLGQRNIQYELFDTDRYTYRIFCTNLKGKPHKIISQYDKRADVENLIGEAKREGLDAISSAKFKNNYAYFQIVMLAYNIWRYFRIMAQVSAKKAESFQSERDSEKYETVMNNTIRIGRLKLLFIAAKLVFHANREKVKYSIHDSRTPALLRFLKYLDQLRSEPRVWVQGCLWTPKFSI